MLVLVSCDQSVNRTHIDYPEEASNDFKVYSSYCSSCHAPPLPDAHVAKEWPNVIARMQQHRVERRMDPIIAQDMQILRRYLERFAKSDSTL
ncbi:MAG: hypothetical protein AUJ56_06280 [Zetaproteobacteria bacterium CG1_02_49_23]|nr:MAG: hypothetical protein AUJ56_06280 [Zetaproteobacteria bacterium CG1_02_49_23]